MLTIAPAVVPRVSNSARHSFLGLGQEALAANAQHALLAILVWIWRKVIVAVHILRLCTFLLNSSDFTVIPWLFKHDFAGGDLSLHVPLLDLLYPFSWVKRSSHVDYFVSFSKVSLVAILINFSLSNAGWKLLIVVSCIIFLFLSKFINSAISRIGMGFHLDHLAYFWCVDSLRDLLRFFDVVGLL